jgi:DNA-binding MurR/RpiR family transcriptional regulator
MRDNRATVKGRSSQAEKVLLDLAKTSGDVSRRLEFLPAKRHESIKPVFERPNEYVLLSLRQAARKLGEDPSTLLRALKRLGFRRYGDFRTYLHERSVALATSLETAHQSPQRSGILGLIESSVDCDLKNLREVRDGLNADRILSVAKKLWAARRILIIAGDMTASLGMYLEYTLSMLGFDPCTVSTSGQMVHRTRAVGKKDVVIAITYGRGLVHTVEAFRQCANKKAYCVGISDSLLSPIVSSSDVFFITPTDRISFADSYASAMAFINALLVAVANLQRESTYPLLKEAALEQRTGSRFYFTDDAPKQR